MGTDPAMDFAIVEPGARLQDGQTYIDLDDLATGPFRARGMIVADAHDRLVAERDSDTETWQRLLELSERAGADEAGRALRRPGASRRSSSRRGSAARW